MKSQRPFFQRAFTMIEMVIAIAISTVMISAVYAATRSMSEAARRQQDIEHEAVKWNRFLEIFRRDLRGWLTKKTIQANPPANAPTGDQLLLDFDSSTDSYGGEIQQGQAATQNRSTKLLYFARRHLGEFQLVRVEDQGPGISSLELVLYNSKTALVVEFYDGVAWTKQWMNKDRPMSVRLKTNEQSVLIKL